MKAAGLDLTATCTCACLSKQLKCVFVYFFIHRVYKVHTFYTMYTFIYICLYLHIVEMCVSMYKCPLSSIQKLYI